MKDKVKVVIVGNIAFDVNTFPGRDNGRDKVVVNKGGAGLFINSIQFVYKNRYCSKSRE